MTQHVITPAASHARVFPRALSAGGSVGACLTLRVNDACRALGIGRTALYELINQQKIRSAMIAGRRVIPVSELERLVSESME